MNDNESKVVHLYTSNLYRSSRSLEKPSFMQRANLSSPEYVEMTKSLKKGWPSLSEGVRLLQFPYLQPHLHQILAGFVLPSRLSRQRMNEVRKALCHSRIGALNDSTVDSQDSCIEAAKLQDSLKALRRCQYPYRT